MDELSITVVIADRKYNLTIGKDEEEIVRKAAKVINEKIKEFASSYAYKDRQDLMAMVALQYTTAALSYEMNKTYNDSVLKEKLLEIDSLLNQHQE